MKNLRAFKLIFLIFLPLIGFLIAHVLINHHPEAICIWKRLFGIDCWGCGITRAFHSLCLLDFKNAFNYNPRIFIVAPLLLYIWCSEIYKTAKSNK